jgi:hypothetical protein
MICNYCNGEFKSISSLNLHKKKAKYCLKLQNNKEKEKEEEKEKCEICMKYFAKKYIPIHIQNSCIINNNNLNNFIKELKDKYDCDIKELKDTYESDIQKLKIELKNTKQKMYDQEKQIIELKSVTNILKDDHNCLKDIAKQPKNITNNNNNKILNMISPLDFTDTNSLKTIIDENYNMNYLFSGQKGIAKFASEHILKDENGKLKYICTDPSRQIFKYKDTTGDIKKDIEAKKLTNYLVEGGIKNKSCNLAVEWWKDDLGEVDSGKFELLVDKVEGMRTLDEDNTEFKKELVSITTF